MSFGTVTGNQTILFARGLEELGYEPAEMFKSVGFSAGLEIDPVARVPVDGLLELGKACERYTGDPGIVHKLYSRIRLAYLDSFGVSLLYSSDLLDFIRRFQKYLPYSISKSSIDLFEIDNGYYLACNWNIDLTREDEQRISEWFSCAFISMCKEVTFDDFVVDTVFLEFSPSEPMLEIIESHAKQVVPSHERYGFVLSRELVQKPLPLANSRLAHMADELTLQYLDTLETEDIVLRVERRILEGLRNDRFSRENIASDLGLSVSSLHARLAKHGTGYTEILESIRKETAIEYVSSSLLRINQIGYALGFQNSSNFSRAFKSWTGKTPREYRATLLDQS